MVFEKGSERRKLPVDGLCCHFFLLHASQPASDEGGSDIHHGHGPKGLVKELEKGIDILVIGRDCVDGIPFFEFQVIQKGLDSVS